MEKRGSMYSLCFNRVLNLMKRWASHLAPRAPSDPLTGHFPRRGGSGQGVLRACPPLLETGNVGPRGRRALSCIYSARRKYTFLT